MAEFEFNLEDIFHDGINRINSQNVNNQKNYSEDYLPKLGKVLDTIGKLSAKDQTLGTPITSMERFLKATDQTIYIIVDLHKKPLGCVIGFLKVGLRNLFLYDSMAICHNMKHTKVVLDFFVSDVYRRKGFGKKVFDKMLKMENIEPKKICIDRPSHKMLAFLKKHYSLEKVLPQPNFFVLFKEFFGKEVEPEESVEPEEPVNLVDPLKPVEPCRRKSIH